MYCLECDDCHCQFEVRDVWVYLLLLTRRVCGGAVLCGNCDWERRYG